MPHRLTHRELAPADLVVLRDLIRFRILADYQIARRYPDPTLAATRLQLFLDRGLVSAWPPMLKETALFSATSLGARLAGSAVRATRPQPGHLRHDVALVDLATYLIEHEPSAQFHTEREVSRILNPPDDPSRRAAWPPSPGHRPDGLLHTNGKLLAIELEHSIKSEEAYARICRWYAITVQIDAVRWYSDRHQIIARLRNVHRQHGLRENIDFTCEPLPPGIAIHPWVAPAPAPAPIPAPAPTPRPATA